MNKKSYEESRRLRRDSRYINTYRREKTMNGTVFLILILSLFIIAVTISCMYLWVMK